MAPSVEELWERAKAKDFQVNAHEESDRKSGLSKHIAKTIKNQDATLTRYVA
jgi:hypothetical protein